MNAHDDERVPELLHRISELEQREEKYRETEASLWATEELYRSTLDHLIEGCQIIGPDWKYLYINDTAAWHGRKPKEQLIGRTVMEAYPDIERSGMFAVLRDCMEQRISRKIENEFRYPDGTKGWFELSVQPVPKGILVLSMDITRHKTGEDRIRKVNRALKVISECNQILVRTEDETGLLNKICQAVIRLGGYRFCWVGYREFDEEKSIRPAAHAGQGNGYLDVIRVVWSDTERGKCPSGVAVRTESPVIIQNIERDTRSEPWRQEALERGLSSIAALPLIFRRETFGVLSIYSEEPDAFDPEEQSILVELANDLAYGIKSVQLNKKKEELEKQLLQSQKMEAIGRLAGGIAHDFNNLLTSIIGYSDVLLAEFKDQQCGSDLEEIRKAAGKASQLTNQLLAFSRKQVYQPKVININAMVSDMNKLFRRILGEDIELVSNLDGRLGTVAVDPSHIDQVIMNLVVNARDAMPKGGTLTIETRNVELDENYVKRHVDIQPGNFVMIAISDSGSGMDEETKSHIFEPFFTTKKDKGTGLGLSTVYGIVKQSRGSIEVYTEAGIGTTIKIYLPRVDRRPEEHAVDKVPLPSLSGNETILVIEDEESVRKIVRRMLQPQGYTVLEAHDSESAKSVAHEYKDPIDLVITDVVMPGKTGAIETVKYLKNLHPEMRALCMSGYTEDVIMHRGFLDPRIAFIPKPFTHDDLARKVREVLG